MPTKTIALLPGDGIGPEITASAVELLGKLGDFTFEEHLFGGCSIDAHGTALTPEVEAACKASDAVLLAAVGGAESKKALDHFHVRGKDDHLVIDTWFAVQAASPLPSTPERVRALTKHPLFSMTTPNKVRALIGTFSTANPLQFNRPDGAGYDFLAEQVLALDRFNPQIAARILGCFRSWKGLEAGRRKLAKQALKRVARSKMLSRDGTEIVSKMLE